MENSKFEPPHLLHSRRRRHLVGQVLACEQTDGHTRFGGLHVGQDWVYGTEFAVSGTEPIPETANSLPQTPSYPTAVRGRVKINHSGVKPEFLWFLTPKRLLDHSNRLFESFLMMYGSRGQGRVFYIENPY